jgi:hypothetical protein
VFQIINRQDGEHRPASRRSERFGYLEHQIGDLNIWHPERRIFEFLGEKAVGYLVFQLFVNFVSFVGQAKGVKLNK